MADRENDLVTNLLTKEACNRYNRILEYNKEHALRIKNHVLSLHSNKKISRLITEEEFAEIAKKLKIERGSITINRRSSFLDL